MKISRRMFLRIPLQKCRKIFLHIFPFRYILHHFLFFRKKLFWLRPWVPPPFTDCSVTFSFFLAPSLMNKDIILSMKMTALPCNQQNRLKHFNTVCFLKTVPPTNCVRLDMYIYIYIVFIKSVYTEGTVFMTPAVHKKTS